MNFTELSKKRRSVRKFKEQPVDQKLVEQMLETTMRAPSGKNVRSTRLGVVKDKKILEKLSTMRSSGSAFLKDVPMAVIVMADESQTNLWSTNSAISATALQFSAESLGLGSCWVHVENRLQDNDDPSKGSTEEYIHNLIPETKPFKILCVVAVGHPESQREPHTIDKEVWEKMVVEIK